MSTFSPFRRSVAVSRRRAPHGHASRLSESASAWIIKFCACQARSSWILIGPSYNQYFAICQQSRRMGPADAVMLSVPLNTPVAES